MIQPRFSLSIEAWECSYQLFVNGALVAMDLNRASGHERHAINHLLRSGENRLDLVIFKRQQPDAPPRSWIVGEGARVKVDLWLEESGPPLTTLAFSSDGAPLAACSAPGPVAVGAVLGVAGPVTMDDLVGLRTIGVSRSLRMPLPFPPWAFLDSEGFPGKRERSIAELGELYHQLLAAYEDVWTMVRERDLDRLIARFDERNGEIDEAYYLAPGTTRDRLRHAFQSALDDPNGELAPIRPVDPNRFWSLETGAASTLAFLYRARRGEAILRFTAIGDHATVTAAFPILFRRARGEYVVSR